MTEVAISLYLAGFCGAYKVFSGSALFATVPKFWIVLAASIWWLIVIGLVLLGIFIAVMASVRAALADAAGDDGWLQ